MSWELIAFRTQMMQYCKAPSLIGMSVLTLIWLYCLGMSHNGRMLSTQRRWWWAEEDEEGERRRLGSLAGEKSLPPGGSPGPGHLACLSGGGGFDYG